MRTSAENGADAGACEREDEVLRRNHLDDLGALAQEDCLARRVDLIVRVELGLWCEQQAAPREQSAPAKRRKGDLAGSQQQCLCHITSRAHRADAARASIARGREIEGC